MDDIPFSVFGKGGPAQPSNPGAGDSTPSPLSSRFAQEFMLRGERATLKEDYAVAAASFERAAMTFERAGNPLAAADAYLELGASLLYLDRGAEVPLLAPRISRLVSDAHHLPVGSFLLLRVFASICLQANENRGPFVDLAHRRRAIRHPERGTHRQALAATSTATSEAESAS